ncbi:MAG: tRNA isopentenyl-2-thiomethyl-A-37 hydroxylase MiaE [Woeseiaceae bacterium]|nr:tRNA isopentenyl-2-thiomethyl-A-37 hydroxylase MiaE [Woeseiaceae bacterium]
MAMTAAEVPGEIAAFLLVPTPDAWVEAALERIPAMLLDHANCELKAASTALGFLYRYPERTALAQRMSRLAREELRHFEQVRSIMADMDVPFERLTASRYAGGLRDAVREQEPWKLFDLLLIGALIEARSCERFARVAPRLPAALGKFYGGLLASEARHFMHYLNFARTECGVGEEEFERRLAELKTVEAELIERPDPEFRFHSGTPLQETVASADCGDEEHRA